MRAAAQVTPANLSKLHRLRDVARLIFGLSLLGDILSRTDVQATPLRAERELVGYARVS